MVRFRNTMHKNMLFKRVTCCEHPYKWYYFTTACFEVLYDVIRTFVLIPEKDNKPLIVHFNEMVRLQASDTPSAILGEYEKEGHGNEGLCSRLCTKKPDRALAGRQQLSVTVM